MSKNLLWKSGLFLVFIFLGYNISAQNRIINGMVMDAETRSPIGFCSIILLNSSSGITTDATGKFKISIPEKSIFPKIEVSYLGYKTDTVILLPEKNNYSIALTPKQGILNEVVITGVSK